MNRSLRFTIGSIRANVLAPLHALWSHIIEAKPHAIKTPSSALNSNSDPTETARMRTTRVALVALALLGTAVALASAHEDEGYEDYGDEGDDGDEVGEYDNEYGDEYGGEEDAPAPVELKELISLADVRTRRDRTANPPSARHAPVPSWIPARVDSCFALLRIPESIRRAVRRFPRRRGRERSRLLHGGGARA
jgi:hypothetical protein